MAQEKKIKKRERERGVRKLKEESLNPPPQTFIVGETHGFFLKARRNRKQNKTRKLK